MQSGRDGPPGNLGFGHFAASLPSDYGKTNVVTATSFALLFTTAN